MQREHFTRMNPVAVMRMNVTENGEELKERVLYRNELDGKGLPLSCLLYLPTRTWRVWGSPYSVKDGKNRGEESR